MKICLIGGIYGRNGVAKDLLRVTPETTLEHGLRALGHEVTTLSHYECADFNRFDAVHVHHLSYGAVRLAVDRSRAALIYTAHDVSQMSGAPVSLARRLATRYVLSRTDAVVTLTDCEAAFQRDAYRVPRELQFTIPNGVDAGVFKFSRENAAGKGPWRMLFVGQLIPLKNVDLILRALRLLAGTVELRLVYHNDQLERELRSLASSLGVADRVHFLGRRNPAQLAALYRCSDLLLLPSDTEALPSVITEAMLCGLPFVASAVGGIPEQAGSMGTLLYRRTDVGLAAAIRAAFENYGALHARAEEMSRYASERFSIAAMVSAHLNLYERMVGRRPRRLTAFAPLDAAVRAAVMRVGRSGPSRRTATATADTPVSQ